MSRALKFWTDWFVVWVVLFSAAPLVALPSSLFSVVHNLTGSLMANVWSRKGPGEPESAA